VKYWDLNFEFFSEYEGNLEKSYFNQYSYLGVHSSSINEEDCDDKIVFLNSDLFSINLKNN